MSKLSAPLIEMFSSIQGEGPLVGVRQVFIRFSGCNLSCDYCDTGWDDSGIEARIEQTPGRQDFVPVPNPVQLGSLVDVLTRWQNGWRGVHHSLSITGGEPLLHHEVLSEWLPPLRQILPIYLETNGVLHCALFDLIPHIDHISMDIKLPSTSGCTDLWDHHAAFLGTAAGKNVFVKCVVGPETQEWEMERASSVIRSVDDSIPLIIQPITPRNGNPGCTARRLLELQELASQKLNNVRVIPQTHHMVGML